MPHLKVNPLDMPSRVEVAAAKRAAATNAEGWVESFGRPFDDGDDLTALLESGNRLDDIHADALAHELGLGENQCGCELSQEQALRIWPVYRAALEFRVFELLAEATDPVTPLMTASLAVSIRYRLLDLAIKDLWEAQGALIVALDLDLNTHAEELYQILQERQMRVSKRRDAYHAAFEELAKLRAAAT